MRKIIASLFLYTLTSSIAIGQTNIKNYIKENSVSIRSITISDTGYTDLAPIGKAIGDARIVMLGEQDHGDAPTFQAKARLLKYLHENLGFKVVAFESDFWGLTMGYDEVGNGKQSMDSFLIGNLYPMWPDCQQFNEMFQYLCRTQTSNNKIFVAGIDNFLHGEYSVRELKQQVRLFLDSSAIPFVKSDRYSSYFLPMIDTAIFYSSRQRAFKDQMPINKFLSTIDTLLTQLKTKTNIDSQGFRAIENIRSTCAFLLTRDIAPYSNRFGERDKQMAANLEWLLKIKYPTEKIIVWAANGHVTKNAWDATKPKEYNFRSLGHYFSEYKEFASQTYTLGFTAYQGTAGRTTVRNGIYSIPQPPKESLESWIYQKDRPFAFIDFKPFVRDNPKFDSWFSMNGLSHFTQKGIWTKSFDGIFYIKDMYPCVKTAR